MTNAEYTDPYLTTYLSEVGYKCIPGFHAEGAETAKAVCHKTGNWSYYPCTGLALIYISKSKRAQNIFIT